MTIQDISLRKLSGSKGAKKPTNTSDNLFSTDVVEALLGISEGPIFGLEDGAKTFFVGETPLKDSSGSNNFENFELIHYKGSELGEDIYSRLGGFGASTTVSTQLATDVWVVRQGTHTDIDYLDVRFAINQLVKSNEKGTFNHTGKFIIEYKKVSEQDWTAVRTPETNPLPPQISGENYDIFYGDEATEDQINGAPGDRPTYWATTQPTTSANAAIWFNTSNNYQPKVYNGTTWSLPGSLVFANNYWTWSEASSWGTDKSTKAFVGAKLPKGAKFEQGDYWLDTGRGKPFFYNGSTWIEAGSSLRPGTFGENGTGGEVIIQNGEVQITGKTTTVFPKEFRIPVERATEPYMIRVKKTSPENTTEKFFDITWESFQEVTAKGYKFPALAATQLVARASEQFSSIPDFAGIYKGRIVRVPSNYNPVTRVHTGVWDGTWKLAYTNNVAYVVNDLVSNDRYGMNAYYPVVLSKWDVYDAGVWCDTLTADGLPRFTYNGLISDPRGGRDAINYLCGIFAGRFFDDGNGSGVIKVDRDDAPCMTFSPENVVDGLFTYSFTEISTRHNDLTVVFTNPDLNWQEDRRRVHDQDHIDQYGRIPHNFVAVGCTNEKEAILRARHHLITGIKENMMVNFKTNRQGLYASPYDVVLIADEDMEFGLSGRVKSVTGARTIALREPLFLEPGYSYRITFTLISEATQDYIVEQRNLTAATGALTTLTTTTDLPALPADAVFTIEQTNGDAAPIAFRLLSIKEIDGDPDNVDIQAIVMHRAKWLYIDGHIDDIQDLDQYILNSKKQPERIPKLRIRVVDRTVGSRKISTLHLDWERSPTKTVTRYKIEGSRDNGPLSTLAEVSLTEFEWDDIPTGEYLFQVSAVDVNGYVSKPRVIEHRFIGDHKEVDGVTGLRMIDEPSATEYESRSPRFRWDRDTTPDFEEYVLQLRTPGGALIREELLKEPEYTYEYTVNLGEGPHRAFKIQVAAKDRFGFLSDFEELSVNNPAPPVPATQSLSLRRGVGVVKFDPPVTRDFVGVVIHASTTQGFTPVPETLLYKGPNTDVPLDLVEGATNYVRIAFYDVFGTDQLNWGAEMSIEVPTDNGGDTEPPGLPENLQIFAGIGFLRAEWINPSDSDLYKVELFVNTVNNLATAVYGTDSTGTSAIINGLKHNQLYYVWARSRDYDGNPSDFTAVPVTGTTLLIDSEAIKNAVINADKLAANAVEAGKIAANAVTNEKIAALSIDAAKLQDQIIDTSKIAANAVATGKIAANAVTSTQIADLAVNAEKVAANAITTAKIVANAITAAQLAANAVNTAALAANAVTSTKIGANAVTSEQLAALAVLEANLADAAVSSTKIVANAVTATKIAANAVTANHILAQSITASKLIVSDTTNVFPDFDMLDNEFYYSSSNYPAVYSLSGTGISYNGARQISIVGGVDRQEVRSKMFILNQSSDYWFEGVLRGAPGSVMINLWATNADGTLTYTRTVVLITGDVADKQSSSFTTAANETRGELIFSRNPGGTSSAFFSAPVIRRKASSELIVDGAVVAEKVAANAITAKHMVLTDSSNLLPDNALQDAGAWALGGAAPTIVDYAASGKALYFGLNSTPGATSNYIGGAVSKKFSVTPGESLQFGATVDLEVSVNQQMRIYIRFFDSTGTEISGAASFIASAITPAQNLSASVTVPAAAVMSDLYIRKGSTANGVASEGTIYVYNIFVYRRYGANLIVDGAVTADKVAANSITAAKIAANTITAAEIAANTITSAKIAANAITATELAANAVTATHILANAVTTVKIAANAVTANEIAANTITAAQIAANTITGAKIAANTITGNELAANTITAKQLVITDWENIIPDGMFENNNFLDVWIPSGGSFGSSSEAFWLWSTAQSGRYSLVMDRKNGTTGPQLSMLMKDFVPVEESSVLAWETEASSHTNTALGFYIRLRWYDGNKAALATAYTDAITNGPLTTAFTVYKGQVTVPAGARYLRVQVYHNDTSTSINFRIDRLVVRKAKGGDLIVNGSITASKLAANSITAGQIAANTITGAEIAANAITSAKIAANTITAGQIAANAITGSELAANAVVAVNIAANAVTAAKIAVNTITADRIVLNGITTDRLAPECVTDAAGARTAAAISCTANVETTIQSVVVTGVAGSFAQITGSFLVDTISIGTTSNGTTNYIPITITLYRGTTLIHTVNTRIAMTGFQWDTGGNVDWHIKNTYFGGLQPIVLKDDTPAVGSNTYNIKIESTRTISVLERNLFAACVKK